MKITGFESNDELLAEIGARIKRCRLDALLAQSDLARKAGVSARTIVNLEAGKGATLENVINVLRALSMASNIDILVPDQGVRPSDLAKFKKKRQRAPRKSSAKPSSQETTWGEASLSKWTDYSAWSWGEDK